MLNANGNIDFRASNSSVSISSTMSTILRTNMTVAMRRYAFAHLERVVSYSLATSKSQLLISISNGQTVV
jgi:hypothetical protein